MCLPRFILLRYRWRVSASDPVSLHSSRSSIRICHAWSTVIIKDNQSLSFVKGYKVCHAKIFSTPHFRCVEVITLKEALQIIDGYDGQGYPTTFDVVFVMYNSRRATSDGFVQLDKARKVTRRLRKSELADKDRLLIEGKKIGGITKTPDYRLLKHRYGSEIMKVHVDNILIINGKSIR